MSEDSPTSSEGTGLEGRTVKVEFSLSPELRLASSVTIGSDGHVTSFQQDLENEMLYGVTKDELSILLKPLSEKGIRVEFSGWHADGESNEDFPGYAVFAKADLNKAIEEGRLKLKLISVDGHDEVEIEN